MRSRTFLNVSLGILALALAYHLGARSAQAQFGNMVTGYSNYGSRHLVLTANGDLYFRESNLPGSFTTPVTLIGNFWDSATPITSQESFGSLKARYRGEHEPQGVKPSTNR